MIGEDDKRLLDEIQLDLPLVSRPFEAIGRNCGLGETNVIDRLERLISSGIIREISAILDAKKIGYKGTLVAARVDTGSIDEVAARINSHPGVSHNYLRDHDYNMWFTLTVAEEEDFGKEIDALAGREPMAYLILPAIKTFKIRVNFQLSSSPGKRARAHRSHGANPKKPTAVDRALLALLQENIPINSEPWRHVSRELGVDEAGLFSRIRRMKQAGAIRRISGVLRHRRIGFSANGMACFDIDESRVAEAGRKAAEFPGVSHCYQRQTYPQWPYSLFAMVHGKARSETDAAIRTIAERIECRNYIALYSSRELKKERVKYFKELS